MQCDKELAGTGAEGQRVRGFWVANIENGTVTMLFFCFFLWLLEQRSKTVHVGTVHDDSACVKCRLNSRTLR